MTMNPSVTGPQDPPKDPLKAVYDDYLSKKLISSAVSIDQFREASDEQLSMLHKQGQESSIVSMKTDLDTFKSLWRDVKKKDPSAPIAPTSLPLDGTEASSVSPSVSEGTSTGLDSPEPDPRSDVRQDPAMRVNPNDYGLYYQNSAFSSMQSIMEPYRDLLGDEASQILQGVGGRQVAADQAIDQITSMMASSPEVLGGMGIDIPTTKTITDPFNPGMSRTVPIPEKNVVRDRETAVRGKIQKELFNQLGGMVAATIPELHKEDPEAMKVLEQQMLEDYGAMVDLTSDGQVGSTPFLQFDGFEVIGKGDTRFPAPKFSGYLVDSFKAAKIDMVSGFINFFSSGTTIKERREKSEELRRTTLQFSEGLSSSVGKGDFTNAAMQISGYMASAAPTMAVTLPAAVATGGIGFGPIATAGLIAVESASVMTLQEAARVRENPEFSIYTKDGEEFSYNEMMMATGGDPEKMLEYTEDTNMSGKLGYLGNVFGSSFIADGATSLLFLNALKGLGPYGPVQKDMANWFKYHGASSGVAMTTGGVTSGMAAMQQYVAQKEATGDEYSWGEVKEVGLDAALSGVAMGGAISMGGSLLNLSLATDPFGRQNRNMEFNIQEQSILRRMGRTDNDTEMSLLNREMEDLQMRNANRRIEDQDFYASMNPEDQQALVEISTQQNIKYRDLIRISDSESPVAKKLAEEIDALGVQRNNIEKLYESEGPIGKEFEGQGGNPFEGTIYRPPTDPSFYQPIKPIPLRGPNKWYERLVDMYEGPRKLQRMIQEGSEEEGRVAITQDIDVALRLVESKTAARLEKAVEVRKEAGGLVPILRNTKVSKNTSGAELLPEGEKPTTIGMFDRFMRSKHAAERNSYIYGKNKTELEKLKAVKQEDRTADQQKRVDRLTEYTTNRRGSGMGDEEAAAYLEALDPEVKAQFESAFAEVKKVQQDTRDAMLEYGLIDKEHHDYLSTNFKDYVNLSGLAVDEMAFDSNGNPIVSDRAYMNVPARMMVDNRMLIEARGRSTEAGNTLARTLQQNSQAHIIGQKNLAMQKFYNLLEANPDPTNWTLSDKGDVSSPNTMLVKIDGQDRYIHMNDAKVIRNMKQMDPAGVDTFQEFFFQANRTFTNLRKFLVNYSPTFGAGALPRDVQTGIIQALGQATKETGYAFSTADGTPVNAARLIQEMTEAWPRSQKMAWGDAFGYARKLSKEDRKLVEGFKSRGGQTGMTMIQPLLELRKKLNAEVDGDKRLNIARQWTAKNSIGLIESFNNGFENSVRLSAYKAAIDQGVHPDKAAALAKYVTVDFNRRGSWGGAIGNLKYFYNPAVQGVDQMIGTMTKQRERVAPDGSTRPYIGINKEGVYTLNKHTAGVGAGVVALGMTLAALNEMTSDVDETGRSYYDGVPPHIKKRNYVIMIPGTKGEYVKMPKAYGYGTFEDVGYVMHQYSSGKMQEGTAAMYLADSFVENMSPFYFGDPEQEDAGKTPTLSPIQGFTDLVLPDWTKGAFQVSNNRTAWGTPIVYEQEGKSRSSSARNSPAAVKAFFHELNRMGGGTENVSGDIMGVSTDYNPDYGMYLMNSYLGGLAMTGVRTGESVRDWRALSASDWPDLDDPLNIDNIPLARKFYSDGNQKDISIRYYDMQERMEGYRKEFLDPLKLAEYAKLPKPDRDKKLSELEKDSEEFRHLAYLATEPLKNLVDQFQRSPIGKRRKTAVAKLDTMPQGLFATDEELKAYIDQLQTKQDMEAIIMIMQATYLNIARDFIRE